MSFRPIRLLQNRANLYIAVHVHVQVSSGLFKLSAGLFVPSIRSTLMNLVLIFDIEHLDIRRMTGEYGL
jgi:hypothetical protein